MPMFCQIILVEGLHNQWQVGDLIKAKTSGWSEASNITFAATVVGYH